MDDPYRCCAHALTILFYPGPLLILQDDKNALLKFPVLSLLHQTIKRAMQIKLPAALLFAFTFHFVSAQKVSLQVSLKPRGRDSLSNASIEVYRLPDSLLIQSQVGHPSGNTFHIKANTAYLVRVSAVCFLTSEKKVDVQNKAIAITMVMDAVDHTLHTVTVVGEKTQIRQEGEKTIIDAEPLANSSTNAYEVLEKTPGAVMDQDGNVYLNSTTPASIYINGVQMKMSVDDIASLLKSLPAASISKIEIIRTPSARYDASNSGGIINIVLKKGTEIGTSGSINVRDDQGVYNTPSAGLSLNYGFRKWRTYLSYQYTHRNSYEDIESNRLLNTDTLLMQKSFTRYSPVTNYVGAGADILFSRKFDLAYDLRLTATHNNSQATSNNMVTGQNTRDTLLASQSPITNTGNSLFINNTLTSKYKMDTLGSEWTCEVDFNYSSNPNTQLYTINNLVPPGPPLYGNGNSQGKTRVVIAKSDLSLWLKHQFLLEAGIKLSFADNDYNAMYFKQQGTDPKEIDSFQTNTFTYKENIGSAYLQLTKILSGFTLKSGIRLEHTDMAGHQLIPTDTTFSLDRYDLFPYFFVKHNLFRILGYPLVGHALFRRSITRPGYDELNPSPKFIDQFTYTVGNPQLKPQFTINYELNATYEDFPVFAIGVNDTRDVFSQVTYQNSSGIVFRTFDNLGNYKEIYGRLFGGLPPGHRYFMYAGLQFNYVHYTGSYQNDPLDYQRGSWTFYTGHSYRATPTLRFNLNAWMYVNGLRSFYELKTLGSLNMSVTKTLFSKKLSIILFGNDILKTNISRFHLQQGSVWVNGIRVQDSRRIGITFRYNFGFIKAEERKPDFNPPPEAGSSN